MGTRRNFVGTALLAGLGLGLNEVAGSTIFNGVSRGKRVGIIGMDTSHSPAFTELLNAKAPSPDSRDYKVVSAYPWGRRNIESGFKRISLYIEKMPSLGVNIVQSLNLLLEVVDVVLLETHDGHLRLKQAMKVLEYKKPVFMDKPLAASFTTVKTIIESYKESGVPFFSSSSLRYAGIATEIGKGTIVAQVIGADTYGPAYLEASHPDLFWYGIHGEEFLYTLMGAGCDRVSCVSVDETEVVTGVWKDGRIGRFRGERRGNIGFGGMA